jgi:hypothetical protein
MKIAPYSPFVPLDDKLKAVTLEGVEHLQNIRDPRCRRAKNDFRASGLYCTGKSMGRIRGS